MKLLILLAAVTVVSPNEKGWQLVESDRSHTVFSKRTDDAHAIASAKTFKVTKSGSVEQLLADLEVSKEKELNAIAGRQRDSLHFYRTKFKGMPCLQYDGIFPATETAKLKFRYFNFKGYRCVVTGSEDLIVELQVSSETNQRGFSESFMELADEFFEKATFPK